MTVHMHSTACAFIDACGTPEQQAQMFAETVDHFGILEVGGANPPAASMSARDLTRR